MAAMWMEGWRGLWTELFHYDHNDNTILGVTHEDAMLHVTSTGEMESQVRLVTE